MSKHMLMLKDASLHEIISFLDAADQHGHSIPTQIGPQVIHPGSPCSSLLLTVTLYQYLLFTINVVRGIVKVFYA